MSEEDDAYYRRAITDLLNQYGFAWVVQQAQAEIAQEKIRTEYIYEPPLSPYDNPPIRQAIASEPYGEAEQLSILLQAIEAALVQRLSVEISILDRLPDVGQIYIVPEALVDAPAADGRNGYQINRDTIERAKEIKREAAAALTAIRRRESGSR